MKHKEDPIETSVVQLLALREGTEKGALSRAGFDVSRLSGGDDARQWEEPAGGKQGSICAPSSATYPRGSRQGHEDSSPPENHFPQL